MSDLSKKVLRLPEPILVVTHRDPDPDGASCVQALLWFLRWHGKEAYTRVEGSLSPKVSWMYSDEDLARGPVGERVDILEEARSLIVCDCQPEEERLGFSWSKGRGPCIVVDHHADQLALHDPENGVHVEDVPSAGCVLIHGGVVHPILHAGLWADTVGFRFRTLEAVEFVSILRGRCGQDPAVGGCDQDLTSELVDEMQSRLMGKLPEDLISEFRKLTIHRIWFDRYDHDHELLVARTHASSPTTHALLEILCRCAHTVAIVNVTSGKVSLRTDGMDDVDVQTIAAGHGGGGHRQAAGCILEKDDEDWFWDFEEEVLAEVERQLSFEGHPCQMRRAWA